MVKNYLFSDIKKKKKITFHTYNSTVFILQQKYIKHKGNI